ncbi:MAG: hypothetical protein WBE34_04615 [Candidatus Nitrosopolaris sp.]
MIENADLAQSFDMLGVSAGPSAMTVLNAKSYWSSSRFCYFVKYKIPIKNFNSNLRTVWRMRALALLNLTKGSSIYENVADGEIEAII